MDNKKGPGWESLKLKDVAQERTEREDNPAKSCFDRYVGSDDIAKYERSVRRWRPASEVTSPAKIFHSGDYLFVRRSLYASEFRERAARAGFSGICSGDILPLRERSDKIVPGYLGIILNHPKIWEYVVKHATGSITKRIKWRDLRDYEFTLPPHGIQEKIIRLDEAARYLFESLDSVVQAAERQRRSLSSALMDNVASTECRPLASVSLRVGVGIATSATHAYRTQGVPMIRNTDIKPGLVDTTSLLYLDPAFDQENATKRVHAGDVVVARTGAPGTAAPVPPELDKAQTFTTLIVTPKQKNISPEFLAAWINGPASQRYIKSRQGGGVQQNMNASLLEELPTWCPSQEKQSEVVSLLMKASECVRVAVSRRDQAQELLFSCILESSPSLGDQP